MTATKPLFQVYAHHGCVRAHGQMFATKQEAEAVAAMFPKYVRAKVKTVGVPGQQGIYFAVDVDIFFWPQEKNPKNEAGLKRLKKFVELAEIELTHGPFKTAQEMLAEIEKAVA